MTDANLRETWAVLPVAGSGSRLRPHTHTRPKPLLYVAGQPIIGHILDHRFIPQYIPRARFQEKLRLADFRKDGSLAKFARFAHQQAAGLRKTLDDQRRRHHRKTGDVVVQLRFS